MGASSSSGARSLLNRGPQWSPIACSTLHLDSLANSLLLPGMPTSSAAHPTIPTTAAVTPTPPPPQPVPAPTEPASSQQQQQSQPPLSPSRPAAAAATPFADLPVLDDDDDSELFSTDSLAAAVTARYGRRSSEDRIAPAGARSPITSASQLGTPTASSAKAGLGSMSDLVAAADTAAVPDTAEVPPEVEGAEEGGGGAYQRDSQATRLQVAWVAAGGGIALQQEVRLACLLYNALQVGHRSCLGICVRLHCLGSRTSQTPACQP